MQSNGLQLRYLARSSGEKRERRGDGEEKEERSKLEGVTFGCFLRTVIFRLN